MEIRTTSRLSCVLLLVVLPIGFSVGEENSIEHPYAVTVSAKRTLDFAISPITQKTACERLRYWYDNFLDPEFMAGGVKAEGPDWIDKLFNDCETRKPNWNANNVGMFFQIIFVGDPANLKLDFLITMSLIKDRPNLVWVILTATPMRDKDSQNHEKYEHNLEVIANHLRTGVLKTELLQK